ncbi:hypothetical protein [uncultured Ruminococcus sp.]|uniref:hypothetical protein n=1 Tax=uncultured Ruminococcus sp. TaxID=165186 RepID=UPI0025FFE7FE|nr:hypothetical protein [uncultured Ruminococcus sp.]
MFSLFRKRTADNEPPLKKRVEKMKCRKINFVDDDLDKLCADMKTDCKALMRLKPVNYYAIKNSYIMGMLYSEEDFSENFIQLLHFEGERQTGKSDIFPVDTDTAVKLLAKVGIMIDLKKIQEK